ncbi:hypothetical protein CEXT_120271 [Caerostris extrusa]|uniref:Uncharacterized protein n=1 Tax=Caerostris extrusa TaxID=172846 RepID=A0AAV4QJU9_CAEEX|nr:hypothetical protein CEXT_120271 [Caerostris extrusa]
MSIIQSLVSVIAAHFGTHFDFEKPKLEVSTGTSSLATLSHLHNYFGICISMFNRNNVAISSPHLKKEHYTESNLQPMLKRTSQNIPRQDRRLTSIIQSLASVIGAHFVEHSDFEKPKLEVSTGTSSRATLSHLHSYSGICISMFNRNNAAISSPHLKKKHYTESNLQPMLKKNVTKYSPARQRWRRGGGILF